MGTKYLLDSNTVIYLLSNFLPETTSQKIQSIIDTDDYFLSVITRMEVLGFNGDSNEMELANEFITDSIVIGLEEAIILRTITLRKQQKIKLPDAIIAATALVHHLTLVTRNIEDFKSIPGLTMVDPIEL
ncbi:MAG: type II toxin-antitoxin system VapC family toxin [Saprospiraceae bacterium]|nr:type II toxin-antitoxin system VapC family toxin [Saprospiraceae bacterium]